MTEKDKLDTKNKQDLPEPSGGGLKNKATLNDPKTVKAEEETRLEQEANRNVPASADAKKKDDIPNGDEQKEPGSEKKDISSNNNKKKSKKPKRPTSISLTEKSELFNKIIDISLACEKLENDIIELDTIIR